MTKCGVQEAACECREPEGHDGPHKCGIPPCQGQWTYTAEGMFEAVQFPGGESVDLQGIQKALARTMRDLFGGEW